MTYRGIFEYEYPTEHKPPISIDVHLHGDCVKGKIIEWEYRPLEQEPTTKNEAKYCDRNICLKNEYNNVGCEDCEVTKSQEPTTKNNLGVDCISKADAERILTDLYHSDICDYCLLDILEDIKALPSVTPIRPKGHWIDKQRLFDSCSAECSSCHKRSNGYMHDNGFSLECKYYDFCPKCGSDNREVEE